LDKIEIEISVLTFPEEIKTKSAKGDSGSNQTRDRRHNPQLQRERSHISSTSMGAITWKGGILRQPVHEGRTIPGRLEAKGG